MHLISMYRWCINILQRQLIKNQHIIEMFDFYNNSVKNLYIVRAYQLNSYNNSFLLNDKKFCAAVSTHPMTDFGVSCAGC